MRRSDKIMGLGPFLSELGQRLDRLTPENLKAIFLEHAKTVSAGQRREFLAIFDHAPDEKANAGGAESDDTLIADIRAFVADLENGRYYQGWGWDDEIHDERAYGDESWVDEMDSLFDRAGAAFLSGNRKLAAEAYGLLFHAFDLDEDVGHFCGATDATDMVAADLTEAKSRYLRALYEVLEPNERPARLLEEAYALRYRGDEDVGLKAIADADTAPLAGLDGFVPLWTTELRKHMRDADTLFVNLCRQLLREAAVLKDGLNGLTALAARDGKDDPAIFHDWMDELLKAGKTRDAADVAQQGVQTVADLRAKANLAERWAELAGPGLTAFEARRIAWRSEPTVRRIAALCAAAAQGALDETLREELTLWQRGDLKLDDRLGCVLLILAGEYDQAAQRFARSKPLGWNSEDHPGQAVFPFLLLAGAGVTAAPAGSVLADWVQSLDQLVREYAWGPDEDEADTTPRKPPVKLTALIRARLQKQPVTQEQRAQFLAVAKRAASSRIRAIVSNKHRAAYERAARMLVGWVEAATLAGQEAKASELLEQTQKNYSRYSAFTREIRALIKK